MSTQPTDAEIVAVMRDGYNCRYNDEADHVDSARAVLAKWGQPAVAAAAPDERADFERWQTDVLCRSLDALTQGAECPGEYDDMDVQHEWTAWQARAVLAKRVQPAVTGEPVSHQYLNRYGKWCDFIDKRHYDETVLEGTWPIRALYTHPQPTHAQAGAAPLTDEWIRSRCKESWIFDAAKQWVRMTEAAHGVKGGQHGAESST